MPAERVDEAIQLYENGCPINNWLSDMAVMARQYGKYSNDTEFNLDVRGKGGDDERFARLHGVGMAAGVLRLPLPISRSDRW
jgi:hypothetical protein